MTTRPKQTSRSNDCPSEHVEQREFVKWFRQNHDVRIFAIPNGGKRSRNTGAMLKAEGVTAGVPDLFIPEWRVFIEMKRQKGGSVSKEQKDWGEYLKECGYTWTVAKGCDQAKELVKKFKETKNIS